MPMLPQSFPQQSARSVRHRLAISRAQVPWAAAVVALAMFSVAAVVGAAFAQPQQGPLPVVTVATVQVEDIAPSIQFIGRIEAIQQVDVRARVDGFLDEVAFSEGQDVKIGDLLFVIEPDQYEAALSQAKAQQASAEAGLDNAQLTLDRRQQLYNTRTGTRADLDQAIADRDAAAASLASAKAAVRTAELNLGYTRITSPIAGRIGKANITVGNVVGPSSDVLARVVQLDPIRVLFSVSERDFITVAQQQEGATIQEIDAGFVPTLTLPNGTVYPGEGKIEFVGNEIDPATGTVPVRATFANPDRMLLPGGTLSVSVRPAESRRMPLVPIQAVQQNRDGKFVLVVGTNDQVEERPIKTTQQVGQNWAVEDGLKAGERVIVEGLQKVRPGGQVQTVAAVQTAK